eukprot:9909689-Prorocentrum_lima.AAC.1
MVRCGEEPGVVWCGVAWRGQCAAHKHIEVSYQEIGRDWGVTPGKHQGVGRDWAVTPCKSLGVTGV